MTYGVEGALANTATYLQHEVGPPPLPQTQEERGREREVCFRGAPCCVDIRASYEGK
jgi:hypothetical protein